MSNEESKGRATSSEMVDVAALLAAVHNYRDAVAEHERSKEVVSVALRSRDEAAEAYRVAVNESNAAGRAVSEAKKAVTNLMLEPTP